MAAKGSPPKDDTEFNFCKDENCRDCEKMNREVDGFILLERPKQAESATDDGDRKIAPPVRRKLYAPGPANTETNKARQGNRDKTTTEDGKKPSSKCSKSGRSGK